MTHARVPDRHHRCATSRLFGRFVGHDSTEENMRWEYLERFGCPPAFCTDQAGLFQTAKTKRGEQHEGSGPPEMTATQIGRALRELNIVWIAAHFSASQLDRSQAYSDRATRRQGARREATGRLTHYAYPRSLFDHHPLCTGREGGRPEDLRTGAAQTCAKTKR